MAMEILSPGGMTTVQDMGRQGWQRFGYQENGACDKWSYRLADILAGNSGAAALEMTFTGAQIRFTSREVIALTGADMKPQINNRDVGMYRPLAVEAGDVLSLHMARCGLRCYLAVHGGIDVPEVLGSRSTGLKCRLGGFEGRALKAGDVLDSAAEEKEKERFLRFCRESGQPKNLTKLREEEYLLPSSGTRVFEGGQCTVLRAVAGPQTEAFAPEGLSDFENSIYRLSAQSDRMACRLSGKAIKTVRGSDIISDGIVEGSVQVSSDGMPIVMMADHQTTGGYAKIATVISADMPRIAQMRPGDSVAFRFVDPREAVCAARKLEERLAVFARLRSKREKGR